MLTKRVPSDRAKKVSTGNRRVVESRPRIEGHWCARTPVEEMVSGTFLPNVVTDASGTVIQVLDYYPWWPSGLSLPRMHDMLRAAACGALECALIVVEDVKANRRR